MLPAQNPFNLMTTVTPMPSRAALVWFGSEFGPLQTTAVFWGAATLSPAETNKEAYVPISRINLRTAALVGGGLAAAGAVVLVTHRWGVRPWFERWGTTETEISATLPGDELVPNPKFLGTKTVTIQAPIDKVWPWLLQMGQGKAGLYRYEFIENRLLGCDMHNSDRLVPEWQDVKVGDPCGCFPKTSKAHRHT
jgi:hypothetical protein